MSKNDVEVGRDEVSLRMLIVTIELRNIVTVKGCVTAGSGNSVIGVYFT